MGLPGPARVALPNPRPSSPLSPFYFLLSTFSFLLSTRATPAGRSPPSAVSWPGRSPGPRESPFPSGRRRRHAGGMRSVANPPNPWASTYVEWLGEPPPARLAVYEEEARSVLSRNESPDIPFRWSVNPYRGCFHGCSYCYARPSHQYLDLGAGSDFERRLVVKVNAPERLARELARPGWRGEAIHFSGNTDCYQPLEASYGLTRRCLEVCLAADNPVTVVTKGQLVRRDAELLARLAAGPGCRVVVSLAFLDAELSRALEPYAPAPAQRLETLRHLAAAGVPVGVMVAPVAPHLNDAAIPGILAAAREAGAETASLGCLRLPPEVAPLFRERLAAVAPERAAAVLRGLAEVRGGRLDERRFGRRMAGEGPRWRLVEDLFRLHCRRLGLRPPEPPPPRGPRQGRLAL
ncbi:MAG: PA0069 family radical SAM protein [Nitrospirae bacterium]|nr:MAG: PA0069 family radical SAM protein [Nitrospirota bacterium]